VDRSVGVAELVKERTGPAEAESNAEPAAIGEGIERRRELPFGGHSLVRSSS
jgi:hypothetical protein